jgi:hypothetical protein
MLVRMWRLLKENWAQIHVSFASSIPLHVLYNLSFSLQYDHSFLAVVSYMNHQFDQQSRQILLSEESNRSVATLLQDANDLSCRDQHATSAYFSRDFVRVSYPPSLLALAKTLLRHRAKTTSCSSTAQLPCASSRVIWWNASPATHMLTLLMVPQTSASMDGHGSASNLVGGRHLHPLRLFFLCCMTRPPSSPPECQTRWENGGVVCGTRS